MANAIALFKQYITLLDEVYKYSALTSDLDGSPELVRQGANANELIIPKLSMDGLGNYSRNSGYVSGDVTMTYETVACNFDRGRMFTVDVMDDMETAMLSFGKLSSEFVRTKVVPEVDAFRMAKYASISGISTVAAADLTTGAAVITALRAATSKMNGDEVPRENRILYIEDNLYGLVEDLDTTKSREVLKNFSKVVKMPQSRFYTAITQNDGTTAGQEAGGFTRTTGANNINFMVVQKDAVIQFPKRVNSKIVTPEQNNDADAYKYGYRQVGIADAYENKVAGIYLHKSTVIA